jgi:hypothetical protein
MAVALLMALAGMVLPIACANIANMLLARGASRGKEFGVRLALGASRARLVRQLPTENILLALVGGGAFTVRMRLDMRVFAYTLALSLVTGMVFGLWPALRFSRSGHRAARSRMRSFLVGGQAAVSMFLLISGGLLTRALLKSQQVDTGYETRRVYVISMDLGSDEAKARALRRRVVERLAISPEFTSVALAERVPMGGTWTPPVAIEGHGDIARTLANRVSPSYFSTLGVAIERGRNCELSVSVRDAMQR